MFKKFIALVCFVVCFSLAGWFCRKQTDGFTVLKICSNLTYNAEWETPSLNVEEYEEIFKLPFTYLARGEQCYVFARSDKKYVLKFFRFKHMTHLMVAEDFASYKLAFNELKEETGLVYLHLNKTQNLQRAATLIDKIGITHKIPLDTMEFLVQKYATPLYDAMEVLIREEKIEEAKSAITNLVELLVKTRSDKGILDKDPDLNTNCGLIGTTATLIDIGRFKPCEKDSDIPIVKITDNFHQWLECRSEILDHHLKAEIENLSLRSYQ